MSSLEFSKNFFQLFDLPAQFELDQSLLGQRFRHLQQELHPDRYAGASDYQQRVAVQYSARVNEAYVTLRKPLARAIYLLQLAGMTGEDISSQHVDGGFLMEQMELREKLESIDKMVDPEMALDHLSNDISNAIKSHEVEFAQAFAREALEESAIACVKMQYLTRLLEEVEQIESMLIDSM
ncbi:MAG: Fe-S protein assembly co-chaperone HscB [Halieaceae bacterium]|jgi:molecular chaperone HscB|nr:Fe-S protein assembly co-chaperone HscB [Halieaceae bacterium]